MLSPRFNRVCSSVILLGMLLWGPGNHADRVIAGDSRFSSEVTRTIEAYETTFQTARENLLKAFDVELNQLDQQKLTVEERDRWRKRLGEERRRFEESGITPWSKPMWGPVMAYWKAISNADQAFNKAFDKAIVDADRAGDTKLLGDLKREHQKVTNRGVIAVWIHSVDGNRGRPIILYYNGKIGDPNGRNTWTFRSGQLTLVWPNLQAPRNAWRDVCVVSDDGQIYKGKNQDGTTITGRLVAQ